MLILLNHFHHLTLCDFLSSSLWLPARAPFSILLHIKITNRHLRVQEGERLKISQQDRSMIGGQSKDEKRCWWAESLCTLRLRCVSLRQYSQAGCLHWSSSWAPPLDGRWATCGQSWTSLPVMTPPGLAGACGVSGAQRTAPRPPP